MDKKKKAFSAKKTFYIIILILYFKYQLILTIPYITRNLEGYGLAGSIYANDFDPNAWGNNLLST